MNPLRDCEEDLKLILELKKIPKETESLEIIPILKEHSKKDIKVKCEGIDQKWKYQSKKYVLKAKQLLKPMQKL